MIQQILNTGIDSTTNLKTTQKIHLVNSMSVLTILIAVGFDTYAFLNNWPLLACIIIPIMTIFTVFPIILNRLKKYSTATLFFILSSYVIIICLAILFGSKTHFQYYLIGGIGIPLIFLEKEAGIKRIVLSTIAILFWGYLEWHFSTFDSIININESYHYPLRLVNDFLVFITVFSVALLFVKENNEHLKKIKKKSLQLEETNQQLEQFAHMTSHDLKNPIGNIWSLIQFAKEEHSVGMNDDLKKIFEVIEESSKHSIDLINSILEYSRAVNHEIKISTFELRELLNKVKAYMKVPDGFIIQYKSNLPTITGSSIQLEQILSNLIGNAIKYHDKNHGLINITVAETASNEIKISVSDDGPGIDPIYHAKIFNLFEIIQSTKKEDSTGVGLAIVKKLVEQAGGKIGLISEAGKGCTFWFTWPLKISTAK